MLSPASSSYYLCLLILVAVINHNLVQCQLPNSSDETKGSEDINPSVINSTRIYGVRWSLSDYFSYQNLFRMHEDYPHRKEYPINTNYYAVAFNSEEMIIGDVFVKVHQTTHTCSHREIDIQNSNDHSSIQIKPNSTLNSTLFHMYRCYINTDFTIRPPYFQPQKEQPETNQYYEYPYTIFSQQPQFLLTRKQTIDDKILDRKVITNREVLFQSTFRPPVSSYNRKKLKQKDEVQKLKLTLDKNILVLGDWGIIDQEIQKTKNYIPVLQPIIKRVDDDKSLVLCIFLGDLGYDLIGQKYVEMIKYIQPITSRIAFMVTPGNHDYIYHQDSFQIFAETFLTPQWDKYYNFYYNFILDDILFISYSPQNVLADETINVNVSPLEFIRSDLYNHYIYKLSAPPNTAQVPLKTVIGTPDPIYKQYHVIVFSHYPIFCSKANDGLDSCTKNRVRYKEYLNVFMDFGMDLYLSGHLHYYERTYGICWNKIYSNFTTDLPQDHTTQTERGVDFSVQVYSDKCPVFLIQGVAGNSYFEQEGGANKPSAFTPKIVAGTGFSVLSIFNQELKSRQLHYTHYRMMTSSQTEIADKAVKKLPKIQKKHQKGKFDIVFNDTDLKSARLWEMSGVLLLILLGSAICCYYGRKHVKNFGMKNQAKDREHVEMVEQNFGPMSDIKHSSQGNHKEESENTRN